MPIGISNEIQKVYKALKKEGLSVDPEGTDIGSTIFANMPGDGSAREQAASCQSIRYQEIPLQLHQLGHDTIQMLYWSIDRRWTPNHHRRLPDQLLPQQLTVWRHCPPRRTMPLIIGEITHAASATRKEFAGCACLGAMTIIVVARQHWPPWMTMLKHIATDKKFKCLGTTWQ